MARNMPQEIEVWYLLPALRRELAGILIRDHNIKQNKVAQLLNVTEAAISQYVKSKRANELKFSKRELKKIKDMAGKILKSNGSTTQYLYELSREFRGSNTLCKCHRKHDKTVPKNCAICCPD